MGIPGSKTDIDAPTHALLDCYKTMTVIKFSFHGRCESETVHRLPFIDAATHALVVLLIRAFVRLIPC